MDQNPRNFPQVSNHPFVGFNGNVACQPFPDTLQKQGSAFITVKQKTSLSESLVIWDTFEFLAGQKVFVEGATNTLEWARRVYDHEGVKFILVPKTAILMVVTPDVLLNKTISGSPRE